MRLFRTLALVTLVALGAGLAVAPAPVQAGVHCKGGC
jgi:hypothetical protein